VREIRRRYAAGGVTYRELGVEFGLAPGSIAHVIHGRSWREAR
jgi:hypothetical protein